MKKVLLKPHVHKVQGSKNYCFYNLLDKEVYQIVPQGSVKELKKNLLESGLIFETTGVVLCKMAVPAEEVVAISKKRLHVVQLHLSGNIGRTCWKIASKNQNDCPFMTEQVLNEILRGRDRKRK